MIELLLISIVLEWMVYFFPVAWRARRYLVGLPLALCGFATVGLVIERNGPLVFLAAIISVFRIFNHLRIAEGRMHQEYLLRVTRQTGIGLGIVQGILLGLIFAADFLWAEIMYPLIVVQLVCALLVLLVTARNLIKTKYRPEQQHYSDKELPTVTVAIPARNETADMEACLQSVLASDYPKLEVIVLDDCSQDKTADIIKSFAHDGVRFVRGYEPDKYWLPKNQAYDKLADEANGQMILFCGVDVRFGVSAIRSLVTTSLSRNKDMISVMPYRPSGRLSEAFIQPMRYWWELALPRRQFNRPPVLSTCWLIRRKTLQKLGGLEAVRRSIIPEGYFAREIIKTDGYSFVRSGRGLDIRTQKSPPEQLQTAIRMRYPQVHRRPELVLLVSLAEILLLLAPFGILASAVWTGFDAVRLVAAMTCLCLVAVHVMIMQASSPASTWLALVNLPVAVMVELILGYTSMIKYEFSTVTWKDRNICIPVMHVYPRLPPADGSGL